MARAPSVVAFLALLAVASVQGAERQGEMQRTNPVRRVVTMLQMMQKKIVAEGEKEQELYEKFMCYCKTGKADLTKAVADSTDSVPDLQSQIEELVARIAQLKADLDHHQKDRDAAKAAIEEATEIRKKEHKEFLKCQEGLDSQMALIKKMIAAIQALEKGAYGMTQTEFIQQRAGADAVDSVKTLLLSDSLSLPDHDRETLASFLSEGNDQGNGYTPQSGEIIGILKQMLDTAEASKNTCTNEESSKLSTFKALIAAKLKEIDALSKLIEAKLKLIGELSVKLVNLKDQLSDEEAALIENSKLLKNIDKMCDAKKAEYELRVKTRGEELVAIADTIKILNDDDALDLFKKTLPSASLLQLPARKSDLRQKALVLVQQARKGSDGSRRSGLSLLVLALSGRKVSMEKVIKMIDDMVALLKREQLDDDNKKDYCEVTIDRTEDSKKELEHDVSDLSKAIEDMTSTIATLAEEIEALKAGIVELDKSVAEATEQRKEENEDYTALMASNTAALQLLELAKNRLNQFYNPKLYKPPPKRELTEAERITLNNGGTLAPTAAPGGIAGTGIAVFAQVAMTAPPQVIVGGCAGTQYGCCPGSEKAASGPNGEGCESPGVLNLGGCKSTLHGCCPGSEEAASGPNGEGCGDAGGHSTGLIPDEGGPSTGPVKLSPPPETWGAYGKKGEESNGVISMIDDLKKELELEMTEATTEEKNSQHEYEELMADSAEKRVTDTKAVASKTDEKAELEGDLVQAKADKGDKLKELMATEKFLGDLHLECDWLLKNFELRAEARSSEIDALGKAKAVLSGADYSLIQKVTLRTARRLP